MQKELNLTVGQKCWSIQLGDCEVYFKDDKTINCTNGDFEKEYYLNGKMFLHDHNPSLFESNPFEPKFVQETVQENKAELINAMCAIINAPVKAELKDIAKEKLQKLLESL